MQKLIGLGLVWLAACGGASDSRECATSADCVQGGVSGTCLDAPASDSQWCAYPDPQCSSGDRWGVAAGDGLARECVEDDAPLPGEKVTLTVTLAGEGTGRVTSDPAGIDCPGACEVELEQGTRITLSAVAEPDSHFEGWEGSCATSTTCQLEVSQDASLQAAFAPTGERRWFSAIDVYPINELREVVAAGDSLTTIGLTSGEAGGFSVRKHNTTDGAIVWERVFEASLGYATVYDAAADSKGDIFFLARGGGRATIGAYQTPQLANSGDAVFLAKLSGVDGSPLWAATVGVDYLYDLGRRHALAIGHEDEVYVAIGRSDQALQINGVAIAADAAYSVSLGAGGNVRWIKTFGSPVQVLGLALSDEPANLTIVGAFSEDLGWHSPFPKPHGAADAFVAKASAADGEVLSVQGFGGDGAETFERVATDADGRTYALFSYQGAGSVISGPTLPGSNGLGVLVLTPAGAKVDETFHSGPAATSAQDLLVDASTGDHWVLGSFRGTWSLGGSALTSSSGERSDTFVAKFAADGTHLFSQRYGGTDGVLGTSLAAGSASVFVGGEYRGLAEFGDVITTATNSPDGFLLALVP